MKLTEETILLIRKRRDLKETLCKEMGWSLSNLYSHLTNNKDNGELTKMKPAQIISSNLNKPVNQIYQ